MSMDDFFDKLDKVADKVVGTLKDAHHPEKVYDAVENDSEDAEVVREEVVVILGLVEEGWHLFRGVTNRTYCKRTFSGEQIEARKRINANAFVKVCCKCMSIAFETQSSIVQMKELSSGSGR